MKLRAVAKNKNGSLSPTIAGLLFFGEAYHITEVFPNYFLDYREECDDKAVRWLFRTHSNEGDWSGNIYDFFSKVRTRMDDDIAVPFANRRDGYRVDRVDVHDALEEALANALAHANYYGRRGILVVKKGKELTNGEFYEEKGSFPVDIALSNDAQKLAVDMLDVTEGSVRSTVSFYNFGSVGQNEIDNNVGTYTYDDTFISEISYVASNRMIAIEDSGYIVFEGAQKPAPKREVKFKTEVQSVFYDNKYVGIVYSSPKKEGCWNIKVYDMAGKTVMENETTIAYDKIEFLDNNEICVRNTHDCELYTIHGIRKFSYTFDKDIYKILSGSDSQSYTFVFNGERDEVRLQ